MEIKSEMRTAVSAGQYSQSLQSFSFTRDEFNQIATDENELLIDGSMYDIVNIEDHHGVIIATCISDEKETRLITTLSQFYDQSPLKNNNSLPRQLISLLDSSFSKESGSPGTLFLTSSDLIQGEVFLPSSAIVKGPISPPPDFMV